MGPRWTVVLEVGYILQDVEDVCPSWWSPVPRTIPQPATCRDDVAQNHVFLCCCSERSVFEGGLRRPYVCVRQIHPSARFRLPVSERRQQSLGHLSVPCTSRFRVLSQVLCTRTLNIWRVWGKYFSDDRRNGLLRAKIYIRWLVNLRH